MCRELIIEPSGFTAKISCVTEFENCVEDSYLRSAVRRYSFRVSSDHTLRTVPDLQVPAQCALQTAHRALIYQRTGLAIRLGTVFYILDSLEPWFTFQDVVAAKIQLAFASIVLMLAVAAHLPFGRSHRLAIFTMGFWLCTCGFEVVVVHERAFDTKYGDGFAVLLAFYSIFIPITTIRTALVGIVTLAIVTVPEFILNGQSSKILLNGVIGSATVFAVLLAGRKIANDLWEREFYARQREAEAMNLKTEFITNVSHEVSKPLQPIVIISEQLASGKIADEHKRSELYRALVQASHRLRDHILKLLEFGQIESAVAEYQFETIDAATLVGHIVREFEGEVHSAGYTMELCCNGPAPLIRADKAAIRSVIWNLLDNAVKYSPDCKVVRVELDTTVEAAIISIKDRGLGIPHSEQIVIFERFVRGQAARENRTNGTGVGLALVKYIVNAHGGSILVESQVGEGSTFVIQLPRMG
jgi:signal transduction histidine kinase